MELGQCYSLQPVDHSADMCFWRACDTPLRSPPLPPLPSPSQTPPHKKKAAHSSPRLTIRQAFLRLVWGGCEKWRKFCRKVALTRAKQVHLLGYRYSTYSYPTYSPYMYCTSQLYIQKVPMIMNSPPAHYNEVHGLRYPLTSVRRG